MPAATVGEASYVASTLQRNASALNATDFTQVMDAWHRAWKNMSDSLQQQAVNMTDAYSQRSMLLRSVVYAFTGVGLTLPSEAYAEELARASKVCLQVRG